MGFEDRGYYREQQSGFALRAPQSITGRLILITVIVWIADTLLFPERHELAYALSAKPETLIKPWLWWEFVTYGFMHAARPEHIILNMLMLWIFGSEVESLLGRKEFLALYLVMVAVGGAAWAASAHLAGAPAGQLLVGASAAVVGLTVLFVLNYPHRTILFMFVFPMPAWLLGVLVVGLNVWYAVFHGAGDNVAYVAHLGGAAVAGLYFRFGWRLGRLLERSAWRRTFSRPPRLQIHRPAEVEDADRPDLHQQVDQILEKIHHHGEASLTRKERRVLEEASREFQRRRREK